MKRELVERGPIIVNIQRIMFGIAFEPFGRELELGSYRMAVSRK